jgi:hypothetical protein
MQRGAKAQHVASGATEGREGGGAGRAGPDVSPLPSGCAAGRALLVVRLALLCLAIPTCRRSVAPTPPPGPPPRPVLGAVDVRDESKEPAESGRLDVDAIAAALRTSLQASGLVQVVSSLDAGGGTDAAVVRVVASVGVEIVEEEKKGLVRAGVNLQLATRPIEAPGAINEVLSAGGEQMYEVRPRVDRGRLAQRLAERTAIDLLAGFIAKAKLATASPPEVHAAIVADGGTAREEAIRIAGVRQLRGEAPTLLHLLQDDEESVRDAALGALIAMRDRRAVTELTRNRSLRDRREMRKILEAIAILGGDEAREYLSFVAETHDDEEIRQLAADAQSRLLRRDDGAPK